MCTFHLQQARGSGDDSERPSTEKRRNRNRSEREQTMNKLAQVRYRYFSIPTLVKVARLQCARTVKLSSGKALADCDWLQQTSTLNVLHSLYFGWCMSNIKLL